MTQYREGADIFTANGDKIGTIDQIVITPHNNEVTHIVIRAGGLFKEERVLPVHMIAETYEDRVILRPDAGDLDKLEGFKEEYYLPVERDDYPEGHVPVHSPAVFYYGSISQWSNNNSGFIPVVEPPRSDGTEMPNLPEDAVLLGTGTDVYTSDDQHVGKIERVFTDPNSNRATHFLITQGMLLKSRKLIPAAWVDTTTDQQVRLAVRGRQVERLPDYHEELS